MNIVFKRALLVAILIVPVLIYLLFVFSTREVFFKTLEYFGPVDVVSRLNDDGTTEYDTLRYSVPPFLGLAHTGDTITSDSLKGKITAINFFFTNCPSICGPMNFHVKERIYDRFKGFENFQIYSFTVDPDRDSVEALRSYARQIGVKPAGDREVWKFVTGERDQIYDLASALFLNAMEDETAPGGYLHSELIVLVDWEGRLRCRRDEFGNLIGAYSSLDQMSLKEIQEDISVLIAEYEKLESLKRKKNRKS
ncbi:MAG: SCO family protein [Thermaurantimonas sp.]